MTTEPAQADVPDWIRKLAASRPFGEGDRRGTANLVDAAARARGAACITAGTSVSLARPLRGGDYNSTAERPGFWHYGDGWVMRPAAASWLAEAVPPLLASALSRARGMLVIRACRAS